jgi:riboflavin kinase / FMN adenylyltransferase
MIIHEGYKNLNLTDPFVTMGIFDGVHSGHTMLLRYLKECAAKKGGESVVITFSPHPKQVLGSDTADLFFLTSPEEKIALLEKTGIDHLVIINFDRHFSNISACDFIEKILVGAIGTQHLILGYNHHFGKHGEGNIDTIKQCSERFCFSFEKLEGLQEGGMIISSSLIRQALLGGNLDDANKWLGYDYPLTGKIAEGRKIGRKIGFPTANIIPDYRYKLIPCNGVYAVDVSVRGKQYHGVMSIGSNPTVNNDISKRSAEVHIIDFDTDIYGEQITVYFKKRLRDEKKFGSIQQLTDQIIKDKEDALNFLS